MEPEQNTPADFGSVKKSPVAAIDSNLSVQQQLNTKTRPKRRLIFIILFLLLIGGGFIIFKNKSSVEQPASFPVSTPASVPSPVPTEAPKEILNRPQWSFEVQNGSGSQGLAKEKADKLKELGYQIIKVGNAENQNFSQTQILVKKDLTERVELVIADIKDIVKIASFGGELKDSTASARIIIGKDSI